MRKEIPILFSTEMVNAILKGRKTMTRRIVKPMKSQEEWLGEDTLLKSPSAYTCIIEDEKWAQFRHPMAGQIHMGVQVKEDSPLTCIKCPYGKPGDIIWVREGCQCVGGDAEGNDVDGGVWLYLADGEKAQQHNDAWGCESGKWKPSIHMPKVASRIWLEVTEVRVERLRDITNEDAFKEGIEWKIKFPEEYPDTKYYRDYLFDDRFAAGEMFHAKDSFKTLWALINGIDNWKANPWVWCISFKVLSTTGRPESLNENQEVDFFKLMMGPLIAPNAQECDATVAQ